MYGNSVASIQLDLYEKARDKKKKRFKGLMKLLTDKNILHAAWSDVCKGTKAAGIDSITVKKVKATGVEEFLDSIRKELKKGEYRPSRVIFFDVPKMNGKMRKIGLSTVKDRVVQAAMKLVLEPIFEADFDACSFGFRAYRSPRLASLEVHKWLESGNDRVFKGDIQDCFNEIPHEGLMQCLEKRIKDRQILSILKTWLEAGSTDYSGCSKGRGILSGGIISPLLMNIYLDQFDNEWEDICLKSLNIESKGHMVRYADDFVILSRSMIDQKHIRNILNGIDLVLNEEKIVITNSSKGFEFLGFYFKEIFPEDKYRGNVVIYPTNGSIDRTIEKITEVTQMKSGNTHSSEIIHKMNIIVDTWLNYYHHTDYSKGIKKIQKCYDDRLEYYLGIGNEGAIVKRKIECVDSMF